MLTVLIPAYNEGDAIGQTIRRIQEVLSAEEDLAGFEILVVNDGSADNTGSVAESSGARVLHNPHNVGYGRSLKNGIAEAAHDSVCIIDADGTYPIDRIPDLFATFRQGFDMVIGARVTEQHTDSIFKRPLRAFLKKLVEFVAEREVPDANSGLRIFSRKTILKYQAHLCDTFSFTTSLTLGYMLTGRYVKFVPIDYATRIGKTKVRLLKDSLKTLQYILQAILYYNPIKIFTLFSLLCILMSVVSFAVGHYTGLNAPYYLGIGGLLVSLIMFGLGLVADLLRQIMMKE